VNFVVDRRGAMIESVYSNESIEAKGTSTLQSNFKMPKNIRQVGKSNSSKKIYVEDYVMTFIKHLSREEYSTCHVAVLVGDYVKLEQGRCLFISGALEVKDIDLNKQITFTNDHWTVIYDTIKKYFVESEIVGWFIGGPGYLLDEKEKIQKIHIDNFAGQDKTLATYDSIEKEEAFYLYENGSLSKQEGYYIYYEKNEEMQSYMVDHNEKPSEEESYDDDVSQQIRTIIQNKKPMMDEDKNVSRLMYAAGTLLAVIVLVVGAAMFSNYDQMKNMQSTLDSLSNNLNQVESNFLKNENNQVASIAPESQVTKVPIVVPESNDDTGGSLDVEVLSGGVYPLEEDDSSKSNGSEEGNDLQGQVNTTQTVEDKPKISQGTLGQSTSNESSKDAVEEVKYYTVQAGDSLAGISYKLYNSANYIAIIKELNNIDDEDMIYIGQKLIVP